MYFLIFSATPAPDNTEDAGSISAMIDCWINTDDAEEAEGLAREQILDEGWEPQELLTSRTITRDEVHSEEGRESYDVALEYGGALTFYIQDGEA